MYTNQNIRILKRSLTEIVKGLKKSHGRSIVREDLNPSQLARKFDVSIGKDGIGHDEFLRIIGEVIERSVKTDHPLFMNQMYGDQQIEAVIGDILTTVLNTSMYTYEVAPLMTLIEKECIRLLGTKVGFESGQTDGIFTSGGSISNMMAMVLARDRKFPDAKEQGLKKVPAFSVFISEQAHYSFVKGGMFLGMGKENIIKVKTHPNGSINILSLCDAIEKNKSRIPLMVVGTAGTTVSGVFDDLRAVSTIARQNKMWFHVDAVWGGSLLFSQKEATRLQGIDLADSVSWNLHKIMGIPIVCAAFLTKHPNALESSLSVVAPYLFHENEGGDCFDLGKKSLQCGRRVDALKLWTSLIYNGEAGFEERINKMMAKTKLLANRIEETRELFLFCKPESPIVCFSYQSVGLSKDQLNKINYEIRNRLFKEGKILLNYSHVDGSIILRCVMSNPDITEAHIDQIISSVLSYGQLIKLEKYKSIAQVK